MRGEDHQLQKYYLERETARQQNKMEEEAKKAAPKTEEEQQLEEERINKIDPEVQNPIEEVAQATNLTEAQNSILSLLKPKTTGVLIN